MSETLLAAVTSDIDSLASIYKGQGCTRPGGYTYAELRIGLENFSRFLEPYCARATMFMVGNDLLIPGNQSTIRSVIAVGHEIANHTLTHAQDFRLLTPAEKEAELEGMEQVCRQLFGIRPVGFRSPGWNISDDALEILKRRKYSYDSSVFPTSMMPILKFMHWYTMRSREGGERTTMGHLRYMFAPSRPYITAINSLAYPGQGGLVEFPITVTPILRLPFFATFLLATGMDLFRRSYHQFVQRGWHIQFQFHLSDFVDYSHQEFINQVPPDGAGLYVPRALRLPLKAKLDIFRQVMDSIAENYSFITLAEWANKLYPSRDMKVAG